MELKGLVLNGDPHSALVQKLLLTTLCMGEMHRTENSTISRYREGGENISRGTWD